MYWFCLQFFLLMYSLLFTFIVFLRWFFVNCWSLIASDDVFLWIVAGYTSLFRLSVLISVCWCEYRIDWLWQQELICFIHRWMVDWSHVIYCVLVGIWYRSTTISNRLQTHSTIWLTSMHSRQYRSSSIIINTMLLVCKSKLQTYNCS